MNEQEMKVNNAGITLVNQLLRDQKTLEQAKNNVNSVSCDVSNSQNALIKWLVPKDAEIGQVFCLPVENVWLHVKVVQSEARREDGTQSAAKDYEFEWKPRKPDGWR